MLKVGFARVDITPHLGIPLMGYYHVRLADGVLDPIEINAIAFDDDSKKALIMTIDNVGISQSVSKKFREKIVEATGCEMEGLYLHCTHTHLAPALCDLGPLGAPETEEEKAYVKWFEKRLIDVSVMAFNDLAPATGYYTNANVEGISFIRRFLMKDGTARTNPGRLNPDVDHPIGTPDELATLVYFEREGKGEVAIAHFQTHPDVIGGTKVSADWPGFVRRTYEKQIPNSKCACFVGTQGDTNHVNVNLPAGQGSGYGHSRYMGEKIALSLIANRPLAKKMEKDNISYGIKMVAATHNKGTKEEYDELLEVQQLYMKTKDVASIAEKFGAKGMANTTILAKACRVVELMDREDERELQLSAVAVGDVVFAGVPGEPFTEVGRSIKANSPFKVTLPTCNTNAKEGYFPTEYTPGSYEAATSRFASDTAQRIMAKMDELLKSI